MPRRKMTPITVRESAYYLILPEVTRLFLGQEHDQELKTVSAKAGKEGYFIYARSKLHDYAVCFWTDNLTLHMERRQRTERSRFRSRRVVYNYDDQELVNNVATTLNGWLQDQRKFTTRTR